MDVDTITADPSPLPSPLTPYFPQPMPTTVIHRAPDPVPSATSYNRPAPPRKANTLDVPRAGPSRPYPPFRLEIDAASDDDHAKPRQTHGHQAAHPTVDTDRWVERRFTLPEPSPAPTTYAASSSTWSAEPPPFRGSPQPMERDTEEESSRPSSTNNDPGSTKKATQKAAGKRRYTGPDAGSASLGQSVSGSEPTAGVARESSGSRPLSGRKRKSLTPGARQGNAEAGSSSSPVDSSTPNTRARRRATVQRAGREESQGARRPRQGSGRGRGRVGSGEASGSRNPEGTGGYGEPPTQKRRKT
ncbi:hypothetical protein C8Q79DRAFT_728696 [Trametes meyenii]|nr:hypothetical protein C8Q79DRAFT_728696 [Trametes meyenii]